jgi:hypothetical protein
MRTYDWYNLLKDWSVYQLDPEGRNPDDDENLPPEVFEQKWFGYPGATEEQILELENRLGVQLPPDYREFLKVSNGWRAYDYYPHALAHLWSTENEDLDWIKPFLSTFLTEGHIHENQNDPYLTSDELYFDYDLYKQNFYLVREEHLKALLEIGGFDGNEYLFLNPLVVSEHGEWECWTYNPDGEGFIRYLSFWDFMQEGSYGR